MPSDLPTEAGGAAPVSQPVDPTQTALPPSTSSDPPAAEPEPEAGDGLVVICHVTGSKKQPELTISVAPSAVDSHLAHGDQLGACAS
jgi:hypothetical protein